MQSRTMTGRMKAALALVVGLGGLIVLLTAILIATVIRRSMHPAPAAPLPIPAARQIGDGGLPTLRLPEPPGTRVVTVTRESDGLLAVTLSGGGAPDRIVIWQPGSGRAVARLELAH